MSQDNRSVGVRVIKGLLYTLNSVMWIQIPFSLYSLESTPFHCGLRHRVLITFLNLALFLLTEKR